MDVPPTFSEDLHNFFEQMLKEIPKKKKALWRKKFDEFVNNNTVFISSHPSRELSQTVEDLNISETINHEDFSRRLFEKSEKINKKKNSVLKHLREHRISGRLDVNYDEFNYDIPQTLSECESKLKIINNLIKENNRKNIRLCHLSGKILYYQKNILSKNDFKNFKSNINYSNGWIAFLIYVYKLTENYPGVQQLSISLKYLQSNKKIIDIVLEEYKEEWNTLI